MCVVFFLFQTEMDREYREQRDRENEERKVVMDFRGLSHHISADHSRDADMDVSFHFLKMI